MIIDGEGYRTHYPVEGLLLGADEGTGGVLRVAYARKWSRQALDQIKNLISEIHHM